MNLHVMHQGQQVGPFDEATLRSRLAAGEFNPDDLSWHEGMTGWKPLRETYPTLFASAPPPGLPPALVPPPPPPPPLTPPPVFPPSALPPGGYGPGPGGYPAAPRPPSSGMPTWAKVLLAFVAVAVLGGLLFVGSIFYTAYRVHKLVREEINRPHPASTSTGNQGTPAPASTTDATSLNNQGFALYQAKNYAAARPLFLQSAGLGDAWGQYLLGIMSQRGEGVTKDQAQAIEWLTKSAAQGRADALRELGNTLCFTTGFTRDYARGAEWLRRADAQNDAEAINNLGYLYENGFGVTKDFAQAREHYQRAANLNYEEAKQNLARFTTSAAPAVSRAPAAGVTPAPNNAAAAQAAAQAAANAALASLTTRDQNAIKDALVAYVNKGNLDRGMEALTGAFVSRENDMKINVDVKILKNGAQTTNFSVSMPARFQKGPGKETFGLARTANGGWTVNDYTRELKLAGR